MISAWYLIPVALLCYLLGFTFGIVIDKPKDRGKKA